MHNDLKLFKWAALLLVLPLALGFCGKESFRYPCQDPTNWESAECKPPICTANGACPEDLVEQLKVEETING